MRGERSRRRGRRREAVPARLQRKQLIVKSPRRRGSTVRKLDRWVRDIVFAMLIVLVLLDLLSLSTQKVVDTIIVVAKQLERLSSAFLVQPSNTQEEPPFRAGEADERELLILWGKTRQPSYANALAFLPERYKLSGSRAYGPLCSAGTESTSAGGILVCHDRRLAVEDRDLEALPRSPPAGLGLPRGRFAGGDHLGRNKVLLSSRKAGGPGRQQACICHCSLVSFPSHKALYSDRRFILVNYTGEGRRGTARTPTKRG